MTGDAGPLEFDEALAELAATMWASTSAGDPESALNVATAADHVHSSVSAAADVLGALSHWYERNADDLFDEAAGAEHDALHAAGEAAGTLRAFAAQLREDAKRSTDALGGLRRFGRRALYEIEEDELHDEDEAYARSHGADSPATSTASCRSSPENASSMSRSGRERATAERNGEGADERLASCAHRSPRTGSWRRGWWSRSDATTATVARRRPGRARRPEPAVRRPMKQRGQRR